MFRSRAVTQCLPGRALRGASIPASWNSPFPLVTTSALSFVSKKMSTPAFGSKPRPDTRIRLVGGPDFFERVMEGTALAIPQSSEHTVIRQKKKVVFGGHP